MGKSRIINAFTQQFINSTLENLKTSLDISTDNKVDIIIISQDTAKKSIGIEATRDLKNWASLKPYSAKNKLAIIEDAHQLTIEAQNAILKLLEEPNDYTSIVLITNNYTQLLETIISRCEIIEENNSNREQNSSQIDFSNMKLINKFQYVENVLKIKDKAEQKREVMNLLTELLNKERETMFHIVNPEETIKKLERIHETSKMLDKNVSLRLILENIIINY